MSLPCRHGVEKIFRNSTCYIRVNLSRLFKRKKQLFKMAACLDLVKVVCTIPVIVDTSFHAWITRNLQNDDIIY